MPHPLDFTADRFLWGHKLLESTTGDFSDREWRTQQGDTSSPIWLLGHLAMVRRMLLRNLGQNVPTAAWEKFFARGSKADQLPADGPSVAELRADFLELGTQLAAKLRSMTEAEMAQKFQRTMADGSNTMGAVAQYLANHESYHFGQLGLIRRLYGKPGIA